MTISQMLEAKPVHLATPKATANWHKNSQVMCGNRLWRGSAKPYPGVFYTDDWSPYALANDITCDICALLYLEALRNVQETK